MYVAVVHNEGKAPATVIDCQGRPSNVVIEAYQRTLAARGWSTGVKWQAVEGGIIDALVAVHKLDGPKPKEEDHELRD